MTKPLALRGQLIDVKNVASHKCVRLSIDVPAEQGAEVVKLFGWPTAVDPVPVAIARLHVGTKEGGEETNSRSKPEADTDAPLASGRHFDELKLSQQAGIMCGREDFQDWLRLQPASDGLNMRDSNEAAEAVRNLCGVASRSEFDHDPIAAKAWRELYDQFRASQLAEAHEMH